MNRWASSGGQPATARKWTNIWRNLNERRRGSARWLWFRVIIYSTVTSYMVHHVAQDSNFPYVELISVVTFLIFLSAFAIIFLLDDIRNVLNRMQENGCQASYKSSARSKVRTT
jgi:hypothetical protein